MTISPAPSVLPLHERRPPGLVWLAVIALAPIAAAGPNTNLGVYACLVLATGLGVLWRPGEPPILLFIFLYQWLQSAAGALYGNLTGVPLSELFPFGGRPEFAAAAMLTGTLALALAMRAVAGAPQLDLPARITAFVNARPFVYWLRVYILAWAFSAACQMFASDATGLGVILSIFAQLKWAAFVLLTFAAFAGRRRNSMLIWSLAFAVEFVLSIGGFFADFKTVFFFALFGLAASNIRMGPQILIPGFVLALAALGLGLVWTAIKPDYRAFVSGGTGAQIVTVDFRERVGEIARLIGALDAQDLGDAADEMAKRLMYHQLFGAAAGNVPRAIPHSNGAIWGEAVPRPFMPRLLFPGKRAINDSELTNQYTGLDMASADQGTSISLGYMAEAYIDFGPIGMFAAIAALGGALGLFHRWLLRQRGSLAVIGAALAPFALLPAHLAETSILKLASTLVMTFLVCFVTLYLLAPILLTKTTAPRARP